ncbi:hypothetical protein JIQ42_05543 [Leishmania sp. Namibia]|uniref:hypothetical protein n=1 Tax=Leishmania sp. Namibia TaxID=2802991 RepID=UPI001B591CB4|nr:hypothetical protein JIQ42_05543 [Leishmania sp. Namibia]
MDTYYWILAFMLAFVFTVLFLLTRSAEKIAKEREAAASSAEAAGVPMGSTRLRRARREE